MGEISGRTFPGSTAARKLRLVVGAFVRPLSLVIVRSGLPLSLATGAKLKAPLLRVLLRLAFGSGRSVAGILPGISEKLDCSAGEVPTAMTMNVNTSNAPILSANRRWRDCWLKGGIMGTSGEAWVKAHS